jgi:hypothetical protein
MCFSTPKVPKPPPPPPVPTRAEASVQAESLRRDLTRRRGFGSTVRNTGGALGQSSYGQASIPGGLPPLI